MEEEILSPGELISAVGRRKWALILPAVVIIIASALTAFLLPAIYRSTATLLIEQREIPAEYVTSSITTFAEQRIQSIHQRILTASKLLELIDQFDLYPELKEKKTADEIIEKMRQEIQLNPVNVQVADRQSGRTAEATIAFTLSYEGRNPAKVQRVTNTITSLFLQEDLKVRREQASSAYDFLVEEQAKLQQEILELEKAISEFKKAHGNALPELLQLNRQSLDRMERSIEDVKERLRTLREKKEELEDQLTNVNMYLEDTELQREQKFQDEKRLELLKIQLIELKTLYSDLYPDVKKTRQEIAELAKKVEASKAEEKEKQKNPAFITLSSRLAGIKSDIESTKNQIRDLEAQADEYRDRLARTPGVEEQYNTLITERQNLYAKSSDLQAKMMEAKVAREFESKQKGERFILVESARLPEKPYKPNRMAIVLIGIVLAIGSGVSVAALLEFSDSSFRNAESLSKTFEVPVLAEIPLILNKADKRRIKLKWILSVTGVILGVVLAIFLFDQFVMDLDVFRAKLERKLG